MSIRDRICMSKKEFTKEHTELTRILRKGSLRERLREASAQESERKELSGSKKPQKK